MTYGLSQLNSPIYQNAYQDGFNDYKREFIDELKLMIKKLEKMEAYRESTTTGTITVHIRK